MTGVRRVGKHIVVDLAGDLGCWCTSCPPGACSCSTSALRCATARHGCSSGSPTERELRLREFGTRQRAWVKVLRAQDARTRRARDLGPEAWPDPPPLRELLAAQGARPLHGVLRDQHVIAGIGRSWVDEISGPRSSRRSSAPTTSTDAEAEACARRCVERLDGAIEHYERVVSLPIPDKLPMPLEIHRHQGEPCPRCGATIEAVHYEDYVMCYCPQEQTGGACSRTAGSRGC